SYAEYPATKDRPTSRHDDLMVVYSEPGERGLRGIYFDSEGHVIRYSVTVSANRNTAEFLSDSVPAAPRFRLTYSKIDSTALGLKFETAPPDKPDVFAVYINATVRRKGK